MTPEQNLQLMKTLDDSWNAKDLADFTGTMTRPMTMADGTVIPPTNKSFEVDYCTVTHWNEKGEIVEENLFYDLMGMLKQIGVM